MLLLGQTMLLQQVRVELQQPVELQRAQLEQQVLPQLEAQQERPVQPGQGVLQQPGEQLALLLEQQPLELPVGPNLNQTR
jgi:hypothetical protein